MKIIELLQLVSSKGIKLQLDDEGSLKVRGKASLLGPELLQQLKQRKPEIIDWLQGHETQQKIQIKRLSHDPEQVPTSYAQQRFWLVCQIEGGGAHYNMPSAMKLTGEFNLVAAEQAFIAVIKRHQPLRTSYPSKGNGMVSCIAQTFEFSLNKVDLTGYQADQQTQILRDTMKKDVSTAFDLSEGLMIRASYIALVDNGPSSEGVLMINVHHIASDGWSRALLVKDFIHFYSVIGEGEFPEKLPLAVNYADYAHWQTELLNGKRAQKQIAYWLNQLDDLPLVHNLVLDSPRPKYHTTNGGQLDFKCDKDLTDRLKKIASTQQSTMFMLLHSAFSLLLSRYANSHDIVIGTPIANRGQKELEDVVGCFVNTLVLRTNCETSRSFVDFLAYVKKVNLDAQINQDIPFELLVEKLNPSRSTAYSPLFQIQFSMDNTEQLGNKVMLTGLKNEQMESGQVQAKFELTLEAKLTDDGLALQLEYNSDIFDLDHIKQMGQHLVNLLSNIAQEPQQDIHQLELLSSAEKGYLLHDLNNTAIDFADDQCVFQLLEAQVERTPDNIALVYESQTLSYAEFNAKANQLAHFLQSCGVGPESLVALCMTRSFEMVIAIWATLKAGGAYVPFDPDLPTARLEKMLNASKPSVVLTQTSLQAILAEFCQKNHIKQYCQDDQHFDAQLQQRPADNINRDKVSSLSSAYVIYTSGSTGEPKGVVCIHQGLVNRVDWMQREYQLTAEDVVLQKTPYSFDVSVWEFIWPLLYGARMVIAKPEGHKEPQYLSQLIQQQGVTTLHFVPSMLNMMLLGSDWSSCRSVRQVFCSGEALPKDLQDAFFASGCNALLHNLYGPTEASIDVSFWQCQPESVLHTVPIGKPIQNIQLVILDKYNKLVPFGVVGELHIGGVGLARGYLNQSELTGEKFIANPLSGLLTDRLYKTGDLVRFMTDGQIEYIGRIDHQVKIRGFRIELGEIENQLTGVTAVQSALVMARNEGLQTQLVAYAVPNQKGTDAEQLIITMREHLQQTLPQYMVPAAFVILEKWPLSANGKINRKLLPAPDMLDLAGEFITPEGDTELALAVIWAELLNLDSDKISATADFFALGGHSLLAVRLIGSIRQQHNVELQVRDIFELSVLSALAKAIQVGEVQQGGGSILKVTRDDQPLLTSFAQQRLWFIDQLNSGSAFYNMPVALQVAGTFDVALAGSVFQLLIERHEPLRTVFESEHQGKYQKILQDVKFQLNSIDLTGLSDDEQQERVQREVVKESSALFDLSCELMLRGAFIKLGEQEGVLLFTMHHIASDGWSMGVLVREFGLLYQALIHKKVIQLPPLTVQYADYSAWQRDYLQGEVLERKLRYWTEQLANAPQVHSLPLDHTRPIEQTFNGASFAFKLDDTATTRLNLLARQHNASLFMLLHSAFAILLSRHSENNDIMIGTPVANRTCPELEGLVGFFVNTLVLRTKCEPQLSFVDFLTRVRDINFDAQLHQDIPFEQLVEILRPSRSRSHTPLFQIMFSMDTNEVTPSQLFDLTLSPLSLNSESGEMAKFDLTLNANETDQGINFSFNYNTDLFNVDTIVKLSERLLILLHGIITSPNACLYELPLLTVKDIHYLKITVNQTENKAPRLPCLHHAFERQAERTPDAVAVENEDRYLTYRQLNERANQLSHYLIEKGVSVGQFVGFCTLRNEDMIVAMMAILKVGGVYVPLDPNYPELRIDYIVGDTGLNLILTHQSLQQGLLAQDAELVILDDSQFNASLKHYDTNLGDLFELNKINQQNLAYVIYTSGSTGVPKGVLIEHGNAMALLQWAAAEYRPEEYQSILASTSVNFDLSVFEIFFPLSVGGRLLLVDNILALLDKPNLKPTLINTVPSGIKALLDSKVDISSAKVVNLAGEPLPKITVNRLFESGADLRVMNLYGPSEDTTYSTYAIFTGLLAEQPPIGTPVTNTRCYVLDEMKVMVPPGSVGELYVSGDGVSRGYQNLPEQTDERYLPDTFADQSGLKMYKTGDFVRYLPDGMLAYVGRIDDQVKIRGFRIELGEIEQQLIKLPQVESALVVAAPLDEGDRQLVAYIIISRQISDTDLRSVLARALPDYMVPAAFVELKEWPLTANGKIDKKALPPVKHHLSQHEYIEPKTATENSLVNIWAELLKLDADQISANANFFELGGHSLLSVRLIGELRDVLKVELSIRDIFEFSQLDQLASLVEQMQGRAVRAPVAAIDRAGPRLPSSFAQRRLWFIDQLSGGSAFYNMPGAMRVKGSFNQTAAEKVFQYIVDRHEPLRTVFKYADEGQYQHIVDGVHFRLNRFDLSGLPEVEQMTQVKTLFGKEASHVFDLSASLMLRVSFIRLAPDDGVLLLNIHHIASDGWSMQVLVREFYQLYEALVKNKPFHLPPLSVQYADYAQWQQNYLQGEVLEGQLSYWTAQLDDLPVVHSLELDNPRPAVPGHQGATVSRKITGQTAHAIQSLALGQGVTPFMVLHGVLSLVLSRHSNSKDIIIGTPVANRLQKSLDPLIGFFVNTLVLRCNTSVSDTFDGFLDHIKQINLDAQANQDLPFEQLVEQLSVTRSTQHTPLFQITLDVTTDKKPSNEGEMILDGLSIRAMESDQVLAKFELAVDAVISDNGIQLTWTYDQGLFNADTIEQLDDHLYRVLVAVADNPTISLAQLPMLTKTETEYLVKTLNNTRVEYPQDALLDCLFSAQAKKRTDGVAVTLDDREITYGALEQQSNRLAQYLQAQGVGRGALVGIAQPRSIETVVSILAILKTGAAYVPMDPEYPQARLHYIVNDSQMTHLVTLSALSPLFDELAVQCIELDNIAEILVDISCQPNVAAQHSASDLAYVIYTSGTTGQPKGVMVEHRNVVNLLSDFERLCPSVSNNQAMWWTSYCFDVSVYEIFSALCFGATLNIPGDSIRHDSKALFDWMAQRKIQQAYVPPFFVNDLVARVQQRNDLPLVHLLVGVEPIASLTLLTIKQQISELTIVNGYGPSETTVFSTRHIVGAKTPTDEQATPIGVPLQNTQIYLVDEHNQLVPFGSVGELVIAGAGVSRGYLNRPELMAEKFIANPFDNGDSGRLYKSGDLARFQPNGELAFIGRVDDQVKVQGYRIELGEIEQQIIALESVLSCLVLALDTQEGIKQLVAYVQFKKEHETVEPSSLALLLSENLPDYMLPSVWLTVTEWPLTTNGKIDKKGLPKPDSLLSQTVYVAPKTTTEKALVELWAELLNVDVAIIGRETNFFVLGGHSLLSVRLIGVLRVQLNVELSVRDIFEYGQLGQLALIIEQQQGKVVRAPVTVIKRSGQRLSSSFAQRRLWFIDQLSNGSAFYNMPGALKLSGVFDEDMAEKAFQYIVERHEPLRTVFKDEDEGQYQQIVEDARFTLTRIDLSALSEPDQMAEVKILFAHEADHIFDLSQSLMLRATTVRLRSDEYVLLFNMHHIASDGWSMKVLLSEFCQLYQGFVDGKLASLPPLKVQYADYAHWQQERHNDGQLQHQLDYWTNQLAGVPAVHSLTLGRQRPQTSANIGGQITGRANKQVADALNELALSHNATPFMVLHAAVSLLLSYHSNSQDIVVGTAVANRLQRELDPLIGFFVNTLVLRLDTQVSDFTELLLRARQVNLDAQTNQDVPFEQLVEHCRVSRSTGHTPLFQIMLSLEEQNEERINLPGLAISALSDGQAAQDGSTVVAKFDLDISASFYDNGIDFLWVYDKALFDKDKVEQFNRHLLQLLSGIAKAPTAAIKDLSFMGEKEASRWIRTANDLSPRRSSVALVHQQFLSQVNKGQDNIALVFDDQQLTYAQLNSQANRLAHYLIDNNCVAGDFIGLSVERSVEMIVAVLAILKAGCAYVPLDPTYPSARLKYMVEDSGLKCLLTQSSLTDALDLPDDIKVFALDEPSIVKKMAGFPTVEPCLDCQPASSNLAYVIYTSGTTGQPKGVMISHQNWMAYLEGIRQEYRMNPADKVLQFSSISFDIFVEELSLSLLSGATLVLQSGSGLPAWAEFWQLVQSSNISIVTVPTAYWHLLCTDEDLASQVQNSDLRLLIMGGEAMSDSHLKVWDECVGASVQLFNTYGPTETTVIASSFDVSGYHETMPSVPIGTAIDNTYLMVLDEHQHPVPQGVCGELYIGGRAVSDGYLNKQTLTDTQFIANSYGDDVSDRLYRSGDLVRYLADGNLVFVGRIDEQVKLRGYRIELKEIERQLVLCQRVTDAMAMVREVGQHADRQLIAYVVSEQEQGLGAAAIKQQLAQVLPQYMVPSSIVIVECWPLTPNGKVDKKALPLIEAVVDDGDLDKPGTVTEQELTQIWALLLGLDAETISVTANFFSLGGHSLLISRLLKQVNQHFSCQLSMNNLYQLQTIRQSAQLIEQARLIAGTYTRSNAGNSEQNSLLITLKPSRSDLPPLYLVHPVGGQVVCYSALVGAMKYRGAVIGIVMPENAEVSIEQTAVLYLNEIKANDNSQAYCLAGWSMGGVIALEMAQQVVGNGDEVKVLLMIDSYNPADLDDNALSDTERERQLLATMVAELGIDYGQFAQEQLQQPIAQLLKLVVDLGIEQSVLPNDMTVEELTSRFAQLTDNDRMLANYQPAPYDGMVELIRAEEGKMVQDESSWQSLLGQLSVTLVQANHFTLMQHSFVESLAMFIDSSLSKK